MTDPQQQAMPPLPEPHLHSSETDDGLHHYTSDQMLAYAAEAVARALAASSPGCQSKQPQDSRPDQFCADLTCGFVGKCSRKGGEAPGCVVPGWMPIETAPPREEVVVFWIDHDGNERRDLEFWDEGVWCGWHDHAEHTEIIGGHGVPYTPPYTHWMRLGSPATPSVAEAGGTIKEDLIVDQAQEDADPRASMDRMADLLTRTANALRGDLGPLRRWSWHDLPERAAEAVNARKGAQAENEDLKGRLARAGVEIRNELRKQGWRQVEPNPAAWRWLPSPHWSEHIIAQDPNSAEEAKTYGMKVEALVVIKEAGNGS